MTKQSKILQECTNEQTSLKVWATFTYYGGYIRGITNVFRNSQVQVAYRTINTTFEILTHSKQKAIPPSGIYKLTCNTCQGVYIGQTGRSTEARYKVHIRYIRTNKPQSAYALHILHNRHEYGEQERIMELVKACREGKLMNCWESLYIQEYHRKGYLITEQLKYEHNILFDHVSTTLPSTVTQHSQRGMNTGRTRRTQHKQNCKYCNNTMLTHLFQVT